MGAIRSNTEHIPTSINGFLFKMFLKNLKLIIVSYNNIEYVFRVNIILYLIKFLETKMYTYLP